MAENKVKWTPEQLAAIELRNKTLLVSAAAGSGKTAVLTERIIKRLTDKEAPGDISRMLIVTFTKAAASELKTRIAAAIGKAVAQEPKNAYLKRQLLLLSSAKICTIHSFCLDIIKKNLKNLNLPEGIGVGNETEMYLLRREVIDTLIDDAYRGETAVPAEHFNSLADMFSKDGGDVGMCDSILSFYDDLAASPDGIEFLKKQAEKTLADSELDFFETDFGKIIAHEYAKNAEYMQKKYTNAVFELKGDDIAYNRYLPVTSEDMSFLTSVSDLLSCGNIKGAEAFISAYNPSNLPKLPRGYASAPADAFKDMRKEHKKFYREKLLPLFSSDQKENREQRHMSATLMNALYLFLDEFDRRFKEEKTKLCRMDYNDLERYAYRLLTNEDGSASQTALEYSECFDEIYIDEYQDTNILQDRIFTAVSKSDNRFMVGDIKQSIYSFRGAAPENFASYRDRFPIYTSAPPDSDCCKVFLSNNFRCDKTVVDTSNEIFSVIMNNTGGDVAYLESDNLVCSKSGGGDNTHKVKIVLAKKEDTDGGDTVHEAEYIAKEISRLVSKENNKDNTPVNYGDIAILFRSNTSSLPIEAALNARGIPTSNTIETEFFENPEILLVLALLNTIDNPLRDIHLAGVLRSPIFDFSLDELINIRAHMPNAPLYEALVAFTKDTEFIKGREFLKKLERFRTLASLYRVDKLLHILYRECSLFAVVSHNKKDARTAEAARENLMLLHTYARDFEASAYKGLTSFIKYVSDIIERKTKLAANASCAPAGGTVKLMTIHKSKGLEFPVVFVAASGKIPDSRDKNEPMLIETGTGITLDIPSLLPGARVKSPNRRALQTVIDKNRFEEEMRVLYVALTRARERLYITGDFTEPEDELKKAEKRASELCPFVIMKKLSFMQLVLTALIYKDALNSDFCELVLPKCSNEEVNHLPTLPTEKANTDACEKLAKSLTECINFVYPHAAECELPAKVSVSSLSPSALNTASDDVSESEKYDSLLSRIKNSLPEFIYAKEENLGAQKGTATHEFMQFCDYESAEKNGAEYEIARLVSNGFITTDDAALINRDAVNSFFGGDFYQKVIKDAKNMKREFRFNVDMPAELFTTDDTLRERYKNSTLFVQGIIDCFFENPDGSLTLVDYKTDRIPYEMNNDRVAFEKLILERHKNQLTYYKYALEALSHKKVSKVLIYSFAINDTVSVD